MENATTDAIRLQIETYCPNVIKHVGIWNNQLDELLAEENSEAPFQLDAAFIELPEGVEFQDIGDFKKLADPYDITIHILSWKLVNNEATGEMEENRTVFYTKKDVHKCLQFFRFPGSGPMNKISETPDHNHGNLYHYRLIYRTTWIDNSIVLPRDGQEVDPPFTWPADDVHFDS